VAHAQHSQPTQLLRAEKDYWRKPAWHFTVETHFYSGLNFVLHFNKQIKQPFSVNYCFPVVGHQPDQSCIPLVCNFSKSSGARCHKYLSTSIFKLFDRVLLNLDKSLGCNFLSRFILQFPHAIFLTELLHRGTALGLDSNLEPTHVE